MVNLSFLINKKTLKILIDSSSFIKSLNQGERQAVAILNQFSLDDKYFRDKYRFEFIRDPLQTDHEIIKNIPEYNFRENEKIIEISSRGENQEFEFSSSPEKVQKIGKQIYKTDTLNPEQFNSILKLLIFYNINPNHDYLYVIEDNLILKHRAWLESDVFGVGINILSIQEAAIFLDLFLKNKGIFIIRSSQSLENEFTKPNWYWSSMRLKLPHYNQGDKMVDSLVIRFVHLLLAADRLGIYFNLPFETARDLETHYHFNYLIALVTGIMDNLALKTNDQYNIADEYERAKKGKKKLPLSQRSLHNTTGKHFLKILRGKNPSIWVHISKYVEFIKLIYLIREQIMHRICLRQSAFEYPHDNASGSKIAFITNVVKFHEKINKIEATLQRCGDIDLHDDPFTQWGFHKSGTDLFVSPYLFSKQIIKKLASFVDYYLELLGYSSFIEEQRRIGGAEVELFDNFERFNLGF